MRLVLLAFTLLLLVSGILAKIIKTTPKPRTGWSSVGGSSRRSRDINAGLHELEKSGSDLHGVGSQSRRRGRDVSEISDVYEIPTEGDFAPIDGQTDPGRQIYEELERIPSDTHVYPGRRRPGRWGRDVSEMAAVYQIPTEGDFAPTDGYIRARMKRDNTKRAGLKKLSTKFQPKKDQSKNKLNSIARSLGPLQARRA